jgi:uncharacterized membrane protein YvbJ
MSLTLDCLIDKIRYYKNGGSQKMAYCNNCGSEVSEFAANCPECGASQQAKSSGNVVKANDSGGFGWGLLGFCIPLVGLVLYFVWKDERPLTAKALIVGAAIGFGLNIVSSIILTLSGF